MVSFENDGKKGDFGQLCRKAGLKVTPQRMAVYKALSDTTLHPSAEQLYRMVKPELPNISLDTVNRTLNTFARVGMAFIVEGTGEAKRFDADMAGHQHFRCIKCKRIIDFYEADFENLPMPQELKGKCEVLRKTVYFEGICERSKNPN